MGWWKNLLLNFYDLPKFSKSDKLFENFILLQIKIIVVSLKHVAQWIEHQIPILKVKGSIPFMLVKRISNLGLFWFRHLKFFKV